MKRQFIGRRFHATASLSRQRTATTWPKAERSIMKYFFLSVLFLGMLIVLQIPTVEAGCGTCDKTVVQNATNTASFTTLVAAVQAAGLAEKLSGPGPFTVFAPTNEAFSKLPPGTLEELLKPENKAKLVSVLTYHVVPGNVKAKDVVKLKEATTVAGSNVAIVVKNGVIMIDGAKVVQTDITSSNGVIHVIDAVILPKQ